MTFVEQEIERLRKKKETEGLDEDEWESLLEYEGRMQSIEAERKYLNGEE